MIYQSYLDISILQLVIQTKLSPLYSIYVVCENRLLDFEHQTKIITISTSYLV
jgi:hypothetical protein